MSTSPKDPENKKRVSKEKLRTIMEAASALTALGDEDESQASSPDQEQEQTEKKETDEASTKKVKADEKRFLPDHKKPDAALTFPEKLMKMMRFAESQDENYCIAWCEDGRSFVIRNCDEFTRSVVPKYFKPTKFSSFTRKLYRWGFRQINRGLGPDDPVIFGCAHFQRDKPEEMAQMRSITAAATRKDGNGMGMENAMGGVPTMHQHQNGMMMMPSQQHAGAKRSFEDAILQEESLHKRLLLSKLLQQQTMMQQQHHQHHQQAASNQLFGNVNPNSALAMASMQHHHHQGNPNGYPAGYHPTSPYMEQSQQQQSLKPYPYNVAPTSPYPQQYGEPARTTEIVNAAIAALRNA